MGEAPTFAGWAVLELMGHRRLGGYVQEATVAGVGMLRIDVPSGCPGVAADYCDVHGKCTCPRHEDGERINEEGPACPLHGSTSECSDDPVATQFYSPSSVYCLTPTSEEAARAVAKSNRPAPVHRYELPTPRATETRTVCRSCGDDLVEGETDQCANCEVPY